MQTEDITPHHKPLLLIIDDDVFFNRTITDAMSDFCHVESFTDSKAGLQRATEAPLPDVILLDVIMPGLSGYQVCRELKQNQQTFDIPVIFVSGLNQVSEKKRCFELGGVDFIEKPIEMPVAIARVKNHFLLKLQRDMLNDLAAKDGLTGIANKRSFYNQFNSEWNRSIREETSLGLLMCDIDHFKKYNDTLGHGEGDLCLRAVAKVIYSIASRAGDIVARFGGEEFAVILPGSDSEGCASVAARLLEAVQKASILHPASDVSEHVTLSIGASSMPPTRGQKSQDLFTKADKALYEAKKQGRNRFIVN